MTVKVRFAPSPTGMPHIGNIRTALITWLFARSQGGHYLLRIDDTDLERSKTEYELAIEDALVWLGMDWDEKARQRDRLDRYDDCIAKMKADGRLYACYETADELALKRKSLLSRGKPPIYDRAALNLTPEQIAAYEADGRQPHWRFKMNGAPIEWNDHVRGPIKFEGSLLSDPVLIREDGSPLITSVLLSTILISVLPMWCAVKIMFPIQLCIFKCLRHSAPKLQTLPTCPLSQMPKAANFRSVWDH